MLLLEVDLSGVQREHKDDGPPCQHAEVLYDQNADGLARLPHRFLCGSVHFRQLQTQAMT